MIPIVFSVVVIFLVAILSLILCLIGLLSYRKAKDIRLLSVTAAFGVFFFKNLFTATSLYFNIVPHGTLELYESLLDLVAFIFLIFPVFKKNNSSDINNQLK